MTKLSWAFVIVLMTCELVACTTGSSFAPPPQYSANDRVNGIDSIPVVHTVIIANPIGYLIVNGTSARGIVSWFMDRTAQASTMDEAKNHLPGLTLSFTTSHDTLFIHPSVPEVVGGVAYNCLVSLSIPDTIRCIASPVLADADISGLAGSLTVNAGGALNVQRFAGSSILASTAGSLTVVTELGDADSCICSTQGGPITIGIPALTSALVSASSESGSTGYSGLTFAAITQSTHRIDGTLGTGTAVIRVRSVSGNISIVGF